MDHKEHFTKLSEETKAYVESRIELFRLEAMEHSSNLLSYMMGVLLLAAVLLLFLISLGFFLSVLISDLIGNPWSGYAIVSGIYLLCLLLFYGKFKSLIHRPIQNVLIRQMDEYGKEEEED